jgi:hypothetical protein
VLVLPLEQVEGPYGREKLAPLVSLFTVQGPEQGLSVCQRLLANQGHPRLPGHRQRPGAVADAGLCTFGGNSTTDNVTYPNLLNIERLARPRPAAPDTAGSR